MPVRRRNELRDAAQMSFDCQVYVGVLSKECSIIAVSGPGHDGKYIGEVTKPTITNRAHVFHLSFFYMCVWWRIVRQILAQVEWRSLAPPLGRAPVTVYLPTRSNPASEIAKSRSTSGISGRICSKDVCPRRMRHQWPPYLSIWSRTEPTCQLTL
jgi:hypothetical protein